MEFYSLDEPHIHLKRAQQVHRASTGVLSRGECLSALYGRLQRVKVQPPPHRVSLSRGQCHGNKRQSILTHGEAFVVAASVHMASGTNARVLMCTATVFIVPEHAVCCEAKQGHAEAHSHKDNEAGVFVCVQPDQGTGC